MRTVTTQSSLSVGYVSAYSMDDMEATPSGTHL